MGFFIITPPLPIWRLLFHVFGYVVCCGVLRTLIHRYALKDVPLRYREWIVHTTWSVISVWIYLNVPMPLAISYSWQWQQIAYVIIDVMWVIEHREHYWRYTSKTAWKLRVIWEIMYIVTSCVYATSARWMYYHNIAQIVFSSLAFIFV